MFFVERQPRLLDAPVGSKLAASSRREARHASARDAEDVVMNDGREERMRNMLLCCPNVSYCARRPGGSGEGGRGGGRVSGRNGVRCCASNTCHCRRCSLGEAPFTCPKGTCASPGVRTLLLHHQSLGRNGVLVTLPKLKPGPR